jgi:hypothetical protein
VALLEHAGAVILRASLSAKPGKTAPGFRLALRPGGGRGRAIPGGGSRGHEKEWLSSARRPRHAMRKAFFGGCGRDCSHHALRNRELTRWGWLARLLIDPDDLDAMNHWLHPELDEQESLEARIERAPEGYVRQICQDRFGVVNWRTLDPQDRRALVIILSNRSERFQKPFSAKGEA